MPPLDPNYLAELQASLGGGAAPAATPGTPTDPMAAQAAPAASSAAPVAAAPEMSPEAAQAIPAGILTLTMDIKSLRDDGVELEDVLKLIDEVPEIVDKDMAKMVADRVFKAQDDAAASVGQPAAETTPPDTTNGNPQ